MTFSNIEAFHGSWRARKEDMLTAKTMEITRGDNHWLGDGVYFYRDPYDAYSWIKKMFKSRFKRDSISYEELSKRYGIIKGNIAVDYIRIFSLDLKINSYLLEEHTKILKEHQGCSQRFKDIEISDGVTLNILFEELKYKDKYDVIIGTFAPKGINYKGKTSRFEYRLEEQICVKNSSIIKEIDRYPYQSNYNQYEDIYTKINGHKVSYNSKNRINNNIFKGAFK